MIFSQGNRNYVNPLTCNICNKVINYLIFRISHFATADEFTDTTLRVITIEKRQYGQYTCKAINKLGSDEANVELFGMILIEIIIIFAFVCNTSFLN